jgi:recombinational DNA repair ATPase RecF
MLVAFSGRDFRGLPEWDFSLASRTAILGKNGSGKTHLLESLHILAGGSMIYHKSPLDVGTFLSITFSTHSLEKVYTYYRDAEKENYTIQ